MLLNAGSRDSRLFVLILGRVLQGGVILAAIIVTLGAAVYLRDEGGVAPDYRVFRGEPADLRSLHGILADAAAGNGRGLIQLGLLVLIATPIARVLASVVGFALERDGVYVLITLVVLALLGYSFLA